MNTKLRKKQSNSTFVKIFAGDPTVNDDSSLGYQVESLWINSSTKFIWYCEDATVGAAVWTVSSGGGGGSGGTKIDVQLTGTSPITVAIPGGLLGTDNAIRFRLLTSTGSQGAGGGSAAISATYGGQSLGSVAVGGGNSSGTWGVNFEGYIAASGATNAQASTLMAVSHTVTSGGAGDSPQVRGATGSPTVDSTIPQNLVVTIVETNCSISLQGIIVEIISSSTANGDKFVGVGEAVAKQYYNVVVPVTSDYAGSPIWNGPARSISGYAGLLFSTSAESMLFGSGFTGFPSFDVADPDNPRKFNTPKGTILEQHVTVDNEANEAFVGLAILADVTRPATGGNVLSVGFITDATGAWFARAADGSAKTEVSIGTLVAGTYTFRVEYDQVGAQALYFINGVLKATITTNLPVASTSNVGYWIGSETGAQNISAAGIPAFALEI